MKPSPLAALALVALAGCFGATPPPGTPEDPEDSPVTGLIDAIKPCPSDCYEPAIALDPWGRIFVVAAHEDVLAVSTDGGRSYNQTRTPPIPSGAPAGVAQFDGTVGIDPAGRLYYYAFLARPSGALLPLPPVGLQVAVSVDGAASWPTNVFLSLLDGIQEPVVSPWKSWIGFAADGTAYLDYNSRGSGLWIARSTDHGQTWTGFTRVQPPEDRIISVFMGPPVVDSRGRLYVPYFGDQSPNYPNPFLPQGHELRVAVSDDRGATFRQRTLAAKPIPDYVGAFFPILAVDDADRLVLAHWDPNNRMQVRASFDRGDTWQGPVRWSGANATFAAPWIRVADGRVSLLYYETGGIGYARGLVSDGQLGPPTEQRILVADVSGGGDFIHFDLDRDARMVVPVPQSETRIVQVVHGPAWPASS